MDIEWIADYLELAVTKNFTTAAMNRNRSQPAFSRRILGLEQWVGASLIDRSIHPFGFTKEGEHFRQSAQVILKELNRTVDECRKYKHPAQDFVKFTALHTLAINYFAEWMMGVHRDFEVIRTTMDANNLYDCVELLQSRRCEFMLSYSTPTIPSLLSPSDFLSITLKSDQLILVSATDNNGKPIYELTTKSPTNYLAYSSNCLMGKMTAKLIANEAAEYSMDCVYENAVAESIKAMAVKGMGVGWLPKICIQPELDRGDLINIGTEAITMNLEIILSRPAQRISNQGESLWAYLHR